MAKIATVYTGIGKTNLYLRLKGHHFYKTSIKKGERLTDAKMKILREEAVTADMGCTMPEPFDDKRSTESAKYWETHFQFTGKKFQYGK